MSSVKKLFAYLILLCLAAFVTHWAVQNHFRSQQDPHETGLEWMRAEYDLDDETFSRVKLLHQIYFAECEAMTSKIGKVDRILLSPPRRGKVSEETKRSAIQLDQALCADYEAVTLRHLQEVATLMTPEHAERFLTDFTTNVQRQRMEHQRALSERAKQ
jgi:hypothetical protein